MTKLYDVLGIGVAAVDDLFYMPAYPPANIKIQLTASERHGGGPACTAMAAIGTLGGRAAYVARLGEDDLSQYIRLSLEKRNVDITRIVPDTSAAPYHSFIAIDSQGGRTVFYDASRFKPVTTKDVPASLIQSAKLILLDHVMDPALTEIAEKIKSLGVPMLGDIEGQTDSALRLADMVDHLIVPRDFALWASGANSIMEACAYLAQTKRCTTIITCGPDGCYYHDAANKKILHAPAFQIESFDTNGCGDTFHGAFALAITHSFSQEEAILFASAAAALKAFGKNGKLRGWAALPTLDDVIGFLREHGYGSNHTKLLDKISGIGHTQLQKS